MLIGTLGGHLNTITGSSISDNGKLAATSSTDETVVVWDLRTMSVMKKFQHNCKVLCVSFGTGKSTRYVFTGGEDGFIRTWDMNERELNMFVCAAPVTALHVRTVHGITTLVAGDLIGNLYFLKIHEGLN